MKLAALTVLKHKCGHTYFVLSLNKRFPRLENKQSETSVNDHAGLRAKMSLSAEWPLVKSQKELNWKPH